MKIVLAVIAVIVCMDLLSKYATKQAEHALSNFTGYKTTILWTEGMSDGSTRYLSKWNDCRGIIEEKHNRYYYLERSVFCKKDHK